MTEKAMQKIKSILDFQILLWKVSYATEGTNQDAYEGMISTLEEVREEMDIIYNSIETVYRCETVEGRHKIVEGYEKGKHFRYLTIRDIFAHPVTVLTLRTAGFDVTHRPPRAGRRDSAEITVSWRAEMTVC